VDRAVITFDLGRARFNYRVVGVDLHAGCVLIHRSETDDFWTLPGGRAELLEPAARTIEREMREELGIEARAEQLVWVVEEFFEWHPVDALDPLRLYPEFLKTGLRNLPAGVEHVVVNELG